MKQPLQIVFHGLEPSAAVEGAATEKAAKLDRFCPQIMTCRVGIELAHKHRHQGRTYAVRIDVTVPGHELTVDRVQHEDVYVALRDAFDDMRRQIEDEVRLERGQQKQHPIPLHGKVVRLDAEGRFGFVETAAGDDYYFAAENVEGSPFEHLRDGTEVQFIPEVAAEGRQAKRVSVGKHRFA
jgi:ribosome-associated translation inhibitor RaiA/cold shock CspA family protein